MVKEKNPWKYNETINFYFGKTLMRKHSSKKMWKIISKYSYFKIRHYPNTMQYVDWWDIYKSENLWFLSYFFFLSMCAGMLSHFSCVQLFVTLQTIACQDPLSMGFSRQEYWSGLPWPPPGDLPELRIEPEALTSAAMASRFFTTSATWAAFSFLWRKSIFAFISEF